MNRSSSSDRRSAFVSGLLVGVAAALAGVALFFQLSGQQLSEETVADQAREFIEDNYFKDPTEDELQAGSIRGMVDELRKTYDDRFSHYFSPKEYEQFQQALSPNFSGVGLTIKEAPDGLEVTAVIPDSPAERAKIEIGDVITQADGEPLRGVPTEVATSKIKGKEGTEVTLTIDPAGDDERREITVERARVESPAATGEILKTDDGSKVAHVVFSSFDQGAHGELRNEIERLYREGAQGLILDLRGNGGGRLDEAVLASSLFVEEGDIVTTRGRAVGEEVYEATGGALDPRPMVVLIDGGTASASEILAAAISDYDLATLVGVRSFGKGSVQEPVNLPDESAINLTIAQYFTADGTSIAGEGIHPDIRVPADLKSEADEALDRALDVIAPDLN